MAPGSPVECRRDAPVTEYKWRVGDLAMLGGEPVAIAGFIDHGGPGPLDEVLVELADGDERTVHCDELTSMFDVIQGHWQTREVYLAGGRLNPSESLAVARYLTDRVRLGKWRLRSGTARAGDPAPGNRPRDCDGALPSVQVGGDREVAASGLLAALGEGARLARNTS